MGLMLCSLLVREGRSVTVADHHPERRQQADHLGGHGADRLGHHPLVFEAAGHPEGWRAAAAAAQPGGVVVLVGGCPRGSTVELDPGAIHYDELELRGAFHHSRDEVDRALQTLTQIDLSPLLGDTIALEELPVALGHTGGRALKWVVDARA
jgi:L-iditol 2-dehydrogenase